MSKIEKCPLSDAERKKYCMCETCLFVKQCLEDMDEQMQKLEREKEITEESKKSRRDD